jgi:cysteine synthase
MIDEARAQGNLRSGMVLVEPTSGNTSGPGKERLAHVALRDL